MIKLETGQEELLTIHDGGAYIMIIKPIKTLFVSVSILLGLVFFLLSVVALCALFITPGIKGAANGVFFDKNDLLYICSVFGGAVHVIDTGTGEIIQTLSEDDGVDGPDDIEIAPNGDIYYTDILRGNICRRDTSGTVTRQNIGIGVNSIAISKDGRVFAGMAVLADSLYEVDPELQKSPRLVSGPAGQFNGSDFGPDGRLYTALNLAGKIVSTNVDADNAATAELEKDMKTVASDLPAVDGIKFNSKGEMFASTFLGNIWKIDPLTGRKEVAADICVGIDNIAIDSKDRLFASNALTGLIYEVLPEGKVRVVNKIDKSSYPAKGKAI